MTVSPVLRLASAAPGRRDVDPALRRALLDEALETQEQDNEELLNKFRQRLDRCGAGWLAGWPAALAVHMHVAAVRAAGVAVRTVLFL